MKTINLHVLGERERGGGEGRGKREGEREGGREGEKETQNYNNPIQKRHTSASLQSLFFTHSTSLLLITIKPIATIIVNLND